jgi:hypothetical protein
MEGDNICLELSTLTQLRDFVNRVNDQKQALEPTASPRSTPKTLPQMQHPFPLWAERKAPASERK